MHKNKLIGSGHPADELPREKMQRSGPETLTDAELLAILLRSGTVRENVLELSQRILADCDGNLVTLSQKSIEDFLRYGGVGEAKAVTLMAALELGKRRRASEVVLRKVILNSADAYEYIQDRLTDLDHEKFWLILLKGSHEIIGKVRVSTGGSDATVVDCKMVIKHLIMKNAAAFIICHNHPSDSLSPSSQDRQLTQNMRSAANLFEIRMLDHIIVGNHGYYSFKDEGLL